MGKFYFIKRKFRLVRLMLMGGESVLIISRKYIISTNKVMDVISSHTTLERNHIY